jgi:glycosyltransferase involved in cell wall biosynthesis
MKISTVIVAKNEEEMIAECINSARISDEIIVIDDYSKDKTVEIAKKMGAKVFKRKLDGFATQKNFGIKKAKNSWVLILDADERLTDELSKEILILKEGDLVAYDMPFRNFVGKKWLRHGGLYPDRHIRLFDKNNCKYGDREVHEELEIDGKVGHLKNDIIHYTYKNFREYTEKVRHYSLLEARSSKIKPALTLPYKVFLSKLIKEKGILDGIAGIKSAYLLGYYQHLMRKNMQ